MLKMVFAFLICLSLGSLSAQTFQSNLNSSKINSQLNINGQNNIRILAVMVEFQIDDFDLTKGDGSFGSIYSKDYGNDILDPLPHDVNYFNSHLEFAKNYYSKVSNEKTVIDFTVLPNLVTVPKLMRDYSPLAGDSFKLLGDFSKDVWALIDNANPGFAFEQYDLFVIFHAGVGKDISTSELLGEARDLPSIYLGLNSFKEFYGDSFNGFQMNDGKIINNTIILPETESREESNIGGVNLLELSINGLIVSSIASYLGLPDLFDAETGKSAIGRFGLMDGQSLFAYAGLFPPEPSAWEKIFLGWVEPTVVNVNSSNILISASKISQSTESTIIKVPINSTEYYLIENRARDANSDGAKITYKVAGQERTITFAEDLDNFNNAFVDTLRGVILDVDEFDWALPGSGILIWHIDEKIINENLSTNRINLGKNRGIDLEEADGIQDIGEEFQTIFGDIVIAEGEKFDFWYSSNTSKLFDNSFGVNTKPNTNTNNDANSLITFSNFSDISNQMNFDVSFGTQKIELLNRFNLDQNLSLENFKILGDSNTPQFYFTSDNNLYKTGSDSLLFSGFGNANISIVENELEQIVIGANGTQLNISVFNNNIFSNYSTEIVSEIIAPILVNKMSDSEIEIILGLKNGSIEKYNFNSQNNSNPIKAEVVELFTTPISQVASLDNELVVISENIYKDISGNTFELPVEILKIVFTKNKNNEYVSILLTENNSLYTFLKGEQTPTLIYSGEALVNNFSLADLKNDGENYIVFNNEKSLNAINLTGSQAEHFPFILSTENKFEGFPITADIDNDGKTDLISSTNDGNVYAISGDNGEILNGFPLSIGGTFSGFQTILKRESDLLISAITDKNEIYFWSIKSGGKVNWESEFGNNSNTSSLIIANDDNYISTYFPKNRTYNYPNPVYNNETFIRTYVAEDSKVEVKVFDLAGDLVDSFNFDATGGLDNEHAWNVSNIQSGAYFARVEVKSNSGKTESKIIKIAVIK